MSSTTTGDPKPPSPIGELVERIQSVAPEGWYRLNVNIWASVVTYQFEGRVTMPDGSAHPVELSGLAGFVAALRQQMYEPGRGTWFSARVSVEQGREADVSFNYDEDPAWFPDVPPAAFARDLEAFPRTEKYIPLWLEERLRRAA